MADTHIHLWGPPSPVRSLKERIARYMSPPLFPVQLSDVPAQVTFHDVPDEEWEIDGARLLAQPVSHPGPTVGYRVSEGDRSVAYIPDHEPAFVADLFTVPLSGSRATTWRTESTCYCTTRSTRLTSIRRGWDGGIRVSNRPSRSPESLAYASS
jgi:phosphoribosyl 1,2-cyclic phosphodiesterase